MWFTKVSDDVETLARAIEETPESWVQGDYKFINKKDPSISIWTANGTSFICLSGHDRSSMNMKEKRRIVKAIHICMGKQIGIVAEEVGGTQL